MHRTRATKAGLDSEYMPVPIYLAHQLAKRLTEVRKNGTLPKLRPDGKTQVSIEYSGGRPVAVRNVVVSSPSHCRLQTRRLARRYSRQCDHSHPRPNRPGGRGCSAQRKAEPGQQYGLYQPNGAFVEGGPKADAGLTGRKIIVDTYGGMGRHGGGAFSGKDPSKVDRSAAYMARYVAKNIVAAGLADDCEVQLAYAIGVAEPVSIYVDAVHENFSKSQLAGAVRKVFGLKPAEIIETLDLLRPIYEPTAAYGHFGRKEATFSWEKTDKAKQLLEVLR